MGLTDKWFCIH